MKIIINGQACETEDDMSVAQLLKERNLDPIRVAVELNEDVVSRKRFSETSLRDGDRVEIVTFVGGG
ncbi:MAG: sulfur carrier protein ThiS [Phycisphaerae bacterium]